MAWLSSHTKDTKNPRAFIMRHSKDAQVPRRLTLQTELAGQNFPRFQFKESQSVYFSLIGLRRASLETHRVSTNTRTLLNHRAYICLFFSPFYFEETLWNVKLGWSNIYRRFPSEIVNFSRHNCILWFWKKLYYCCTFSCFLLFSNSQ